MTIKIDVEKLTKIIETELVETGGACVRTDVCIGEIDGKQIHISIIADEDDFDDSGTKWHCITNEKPARVKKAK